MEDIWRYFGDKYAQTGMNLLDAVIVFIVGWYLIKVIIHLLMKMMKKSSVDPIIVNFIKSIVDIALKIILGITVLTVTGIPATSFVAVLTTGGAAIVLGLQDSMKGFVSGMTILFAKPFVKGDIIEVNGYIGKIQEIQMLYTILMTFDNKMVVIPNNELASSTFVNYSHEDIRRVDLVMDIHYDNDIELAKSVIRQVIEEHPHALKEPLPYVRVSEYKDNSIAIAIRVWTKTEHYYELKDDMVEQMKVAFDQNHIVIPYPQLDIHIHHLEKTKN